jgi:hypothetical protein
MKRKIYNKLLEWKKESADKYALLVEGARRVGYNVPPNASSQGQR